MMDLAVIKPRSVETVHTHTHTSDLEKNVIYKKVKGNIILPCGFYDTG